MREIEIKAHVKDAECLKKRIDSICGFGRVVSKKDTYLRNAEGALMRIRDNSGNLEATVKQSNKSALGEENNLEYEILLSSSFEDSLAFFNAIGYSFYFNKYKDGWDWHYDGVHIELLKVNELGWFLEMEILLPFSVDSDRVDREHSKLKSLLDMFSIDLSAIEKRSYRMMILGE